MLIGAEIENETVHPLAKNNSGGLMDDKVVKLEDKRKSKESNKEAEHRKKVIAALIKHAKTLNW